MSGDWVYFVMLLGFPFHPIISLQKCAVLSCLRSMRVTCRKTNRINERTSSMWTCNDRLIIMQSNSTIYCKIPPSFQLQTCTIWDQSQTLSSCWLVQPRLYLAFKSSQLEIWENLCSYYSTLNEAVTLLVNVVGFLTRALIIKNIFIFINSSLEYNYRLLNNEII